jgi:hypothetical protein
LSFPPNQEKHSHQQCVNLSKLCICMRGNGSGSVRAGS